MVGTTLLFTWRPWRHFERFAASTAAITRRIRSNRGEVCISEKDYKCRCYGWLKDNKTMFIGDESVLCFK
jgi:phosphatidylserine decarboxylase